MFKLSSKGSLIEIFCCTMFLGLAVFQLVESWFLFESCEKHF